MFKYTVVLKNGEIDSIQGGEIKITGERVLLIYCVVKSLLPTQQMRGGR
jgi:hypothetical protein